MIIVSMEKESLFLSYVRLILKKWVGFQAALAEGMGGPYAKEKEIWMGSEIENYFKRYSDVTPDDVEDYIGSMLETEFDTYFEDGSLLEVSKIFCRAYGLSFTDPKSPIFEEVHKSQEAKSSSHFPSSQIEVMKDDKTEFDPSVECSMSQNEDVNQVDSGTSIDAGMEQLTINGTEDNEWTVVNRKGHRK